MLAYSVCSGGRQTIVPEPINALPARNCDHVRCDVLRAFVSLISKRGKFVDALSAVIIETKYQRLKYRWSINI